MFNDLRSRTTLFQAYLHNARRFYRFISVPISCRNHLRIFAVTNPIVFIPLESSLLFFRRSTAATTWRIVLIAQDTSRALCFAALECECALSRKISRLTGQPEKFACSIEERSHLVTWFYMNVYPPLDMSYLGEVFQRAVLLLHN